MASAYNQLTTTLRSRPRTWLVTGAAGFIGSNLVEALLRLDQQVIGLDNFSTGLQAALDDVQASVGSERWQRFVLHRGDITRLSDCQAACAGVDVVLHQAALGSVPRSIADPIASHAANVDGFLHMLVAARDAGVKRFVYASSSSVYGDHPGLPKVEDAIGQPLSPYAATKRTDEIYAAVFARTYGLEPIGLRYFNVFGRRQRPDGTYAAVIPRWVAALLQDLPCVILGDGETSRDFCYVDNVVQANLLAGCVSDAEACNQVYNVAFGDRTTLNQLFEAIRDGLAMHQPAVASRTPVYDAFRPGDVRHSLADISKARRLLGYQPTHNLTQGLAEALRWYQANLLDRQAKAG